MRGFRHFFSVPPLNTKRIIVRGLAILEEVPPRIVDRRRGSGDYLFIYFYDPVWLSSVDLPSAEQPGGTLVIYTPGRWQYYGNRDHSFRHSWMHCDGQIVRNLLKESGVPVDCPQRVADAGIVERGFCGIYEELAKQPKPDAMIVRNLLDNLLREVARAIRHSPSDVPPQLWQARQIIESEYGRKLPVAELAAKAALWAGWRRQSAQRSPSRRNPRADARSPPDSAS